MCDLRWTAAEASDDHPLLHTRRGSFFASNAVNFSILADFSDSSCRATLCLSCPVVAFSPAHPYFYVSLARVAVVPGSLGQILPPMP